jgi:hypothetical protein
MLRQSACGQLVLVAALWLNPNLMAAEPAPPKEGRNPDPPLSAALPNEWRQLPVFGSISWTTKRLPWVKDGPHAGISGAAMAAHRDRLYIAGGFIPAGDASTDTDSQRTSRWLWMYDTTSDTWQQLADIPVRREYTRGIVANDAFYLIGGACQYRTQQPPYRVHGEAIRLDLAHDQPNWSMHSQLNVPRTHTAVGKVGTRLIVVGGNEYDSAEGGYSVNTIRATTEVFDTSAPEHGWQIKPSLPGNPRGWAASTQTQNHLYVFGGLTWLTSGSILGLRDTCRYDPVAELWELRAETPLAVSGWEGGLFANRYVLLAGGVKRSASSSDQSIVWSDLVWAYDTKDDLWLRVNGSLPPGAVFNDPGVAVVGNTIYVLGAEGPFGSHYNYFLVGEIRIR